MNRREATFIPMVFDAFKPMRFIAPLALPLGIRPEDTSPEAFVARRNLHSVAASINPKGYRTPGKKRGITKAPAKRDRSERLAFLARMQRGHSTANFMGVA
ncbi:MAG: hypothetical protein KG075_23825 [Alphaproteobacteria bacterium]|nr:hypothetical protein [Alphaproteobacteria bacterium]